MRQHRATATSTLGRPSARPPRRSATFLLLLLALAGCASTSSSRPAPQDGAAAAAPAAAPAPRKSDVLAQAIEDVLLAREQARLGLTDEAVAAWDRAIAQLAPFAAQDAQLAERVAQIEAERDQALKDAEIRAQGDDDEDATEVAQVEVLDSPEPALDPALLPEVGKAAQEVTPDYPVVLNDRVYAWIEAWSGRLSGFFAGSLERSGRYVERFRQIFAEEGLPQDLVYLAHVESGFKTTAYSRAAARGIYQFIAETGKRYGLTANWWVDERADPEKSCRAAAAYLRDLYAEFGDWYLAMAAYNAGEGKVRDVIGRTGRRDFWDPANQRLFRVETRNYVPAILAATLIAKNPAKFGFGQVQPQAPVPFEVVTIPGPTSLTVLAEVIGVEADVLRDLNPALRRHSTPPGYPDFLLKVPVGAAGGFAEKLAKVPTDERLVQLEHVVRQGETLSRIAARYGVSTRALARANELGRRPRVSTGMVLVIPDDPSAAAIEREARASGSGGRRATVHTVKRGETLGRIASRYGVTVKQLRSWNKLASNNVRVGQKLRIASPQRGVRDADAPQVASATKKKKGGAAAPAAPSGKAPSAPAAASAGTTHVVRAGDTLWNISQRYGVSLDDLRAANRLGKSGAVKVGQRLKIPARTAEAKRSDAKPAAPARHVVRRGETLSAIARRFGMSVEQLCRLNAIAPDAKIAPGDTLTVR